MSSLVAHVRNEGPGDRVAVQVGLEAAPHRGSLTEVVACGATALGVSRHDPTDRADIVEANGQVVAVAGVIDNLSELVSDLRDRGVAVADERPAVVVLAALSAFGDDLPRALRGAYAIAVSDGRTVRAFRDHLGSGPLFYRSAGGQTWLGSEAKQVLASAALPREPDLDAIEAIFYGYREDDLATAVRGVTRLAKASEIATDGATVRVRRYWDPTSLVESLRIPRDQLRPTFDRLMGRAVERVLRGDDVLALSGGIDSPTVAAFAAETYRQRYGRPLPVLSMVFPDYPSADESGYINEVVERFGLELHTYQPSREAQTLEGLDRWTNLTDGPWMGWWEPGMDEDRYRRIGELGRRNYLTGDFAEFASAIPFHVVPHLIWKGHIRDALQHVRDQYRLGIRRRNIARQLASAFLPGRFFVWYRGVRPVWPVPEWQDPSRVIPTNVVERMQPWERWRHFQLAGYTGVGLPFEAYHMFNESQRVAVRWPWADVDLWEFFMGLPAEVKFPTARPKELTRRFIRGRVPDRIVNRRERTVLDEFIQRSFDYGSLQRWIDTGDYRLPGIDYARLKARIERGDLENYEYEAAKDVAQVHAFLANWSGTKAAPPLAGSATR